MGAQPVSHLGKVQRTMPLMDLHRIPSAQSDMRSPLTSQMNKLVQSASPATGARRGRSNLGPLISPQIKREQRPPDPSHITNQNFQGFGDRDRRAKVYR